MADRLSRFTRAEDGYAAIDVETGELFEFEEAAGELPFRANLRLVRLETVEHDPSVSRLHGKSGFPVKERKWPGQSQARAR